MTSHTARRWIVVGGILMAALTACSSEQPATQQQPAGGSSSGPVGTRDLPGVGTVLIDTTGKTLYFTDNDMAGNIKCVAQCNQLWIPAVPPSPSPQGSDLGVIQRPDGTNQLTFQNRPLYTFTLDSQDKPASGHNAKDNFGGVDFTWHAAVVKAGAAPTTTGDGGYGGQQPGGY